MSIAPPSDIILDVAQAADPQRLQAATTKLNTMAASAGGAAVDFQTLLAGAARRPWSPGGVSGAPPSPYTPHGGGTTQAMSPYRKFEAVLLQTFVQEMLPKDDKLFGDAASADAYRSMMAEQLANQLARSGGIGIAKMIEKAHAAQAATGAPATGAAAGAAVPGVQASAAPAPAPRPSPTPLAAAGPEAAAPSPPPEAERG